MNEPGVAQRNSAGRLEDRRLVTGAGAFTGDRLPPATCHAAFLRSPHAHARIVRIDTASARASPGVLAVFTADSLAEDGVPDSAPVVKLKRPDGSNAAVTPRPLLIGEEVRHIGEPVAMVIAESVALALDAMELIEVDYDGLPAVDSSPAALADGALPVWAEVPDNIAFLWRGGDREAVARAIAAAPHVTRLEYRLSRVAAAPLEPRITLAEPAADGSMRVYSSTQTPYELRDALAGAFGWPRERIRVIVGDVGGSFGMKAGFFREDALVVWAASRLNRPVRWRSDRSEAFLADDQARDVHFQAALALDADGTFLALEVRYDVNLGAYFSIRSVGPINNVGGIAGVYRTPLVAADIYGVLTHTIPTAPYRGAGRPDATYAIERLIDVAAGEMGIDPIELRRRNLIPAEAMPYKTGFLFEYDCGDFRANMDAAAILADVAGYPARKAEAAGRGRLRGLGVCNPIEPAGGPYGNPMPDRARLLVREDGMVHVFTGAMSVGQGHETTLSRMIAARLGQPVDRIVYHQGDTSGLPTGRGNGGSSGLCVSGNAVFLAIEETIAAGRVLAAETLEAAADDIEYDSGRFAVAGTDRAVSLTEVAKIAAERSGGGEPGLAVTAVYQPPKVTFPNGSHLCEVEVDPETGAVEVISYVAVEDIGRVLDPPLVDGQIHGGVAQGMGQALLEQVVYDPASAQLLTGSFMDYAMPRASDIPRIVVQTREVPTRVNALGAKGVGEAGTVGALAATMNAICDALGPLGVRHLDMPATPERIWAAIRDASRESS